MKFLHMRLTYSELKMFLLFTFLRLLFLFDVILDSYITSEIAQLGERQTEDLKVPGSNSVNSHEL